MTFRNKNVHIFKRIAAWITGIADTYVTFKLEQYKWPRGGPNREKINATFLYINVLILQRHYHQTFLLLEVPFY